MKDIGKPEQVAPHWQDVSKRSGKGKAKKRKPKSIQKFVERHYHVATREVAEVFELSMEEAQNKLEDLELKGRVRKLKVANGYFWESAE